MCGIYLNRDVYEFLGKKRCYQFLKFVEPFRDKKLQKISFWQLEKKKSMFVGIKKYSFIFIYFFKKKKLYQYLTTNVKEKYGCGKKQFSVKTWAISFWQLEKKKKNEAHLWKKKKQFHFFSKS